jgi:hypothetical protein
LVKINKNLLSIYGFLLFLLFLNPELAFSQGLNGTFVITNPSPYVSEWETNESIAILTIINSKRTMDVDVRARLNKDGQQVSSVLSGDITQIRGPDGPGKPPVTTIFRTTQIAKWSQLKFTGSLKESVERTGRLPEGNYEVCIDIVQKNLQQGENASNITLCSSFLIMMLAQPPKLILPQDNSDVREKFPQFQWTPVIGANEIKYKVKIVEVTGQQSPSQAFDVNIPFYESELNTTSFIFPQSAQSFEEGKNYAWRVQSLDANNKPFGLNDGKSEISGFKYTGQLKVPILTTMPDTLIAGTFRIAVESWDDPSKSINSSLPSGFGRVQFDCNKSSIKIPWGKNIHLMKKGLNIVQEIQDSTSELNLKQAKYIKKDVEIGDKLELELPETINKFEQITNINSLIHIYENKSPQGIKVAFRDVKWSGPVQPTVTLTDGFAWYPTVSPDPTPPAKIDLNSGFSLAIDSFAITPTEAKVKGSVLLPNSIISTSICTSAKLGLPLTTITSNCEFYSNDPDSTFGPFYIGESDLIIKGKGYVLDFSSSQSDPTVSPPLSNSWKGVVLKNGDTPDPTADSIISNRGYVHAKYSFSNGLITETGFAGNLGLNSPFTFFSLDPYGYEVDLQTGNLNFDSSSISGGQFNNTNIKLPEKAIRNFSMNRIQLSNVNLNVQNDMGLFGDITYGGSVVWGEFSKTDGTPKFYQLDGDYSNTFTGNFFMSAKFVNPYYPVNDTGAFIPPSFNLPIDTMLEYQRMQGATFSNINGKKYTIWTKDLPASDTASGFVFPKEMIAGSWINVIRTGINSEVKIQFRAPINDKHLGPSWSPNFRGDTISGFNTSFGFYDYKQDFGYMEMKFVESAMFDSDFRGKITLDRGIKDTVDFKKMMFTSTANNAGGQLDLSKKLNMDYWGVSLVPKDSTLSAGIVCVKLGVIYLTAAGISEPVHYSTPFWLTWGEIKATGDLGQLFFDYNNVGQRFDEFYYAPSYIELSKYSPPDSGFVQTYGSLSVSFFGAKWMSISDYKSAISNGPFFNRYVTVRKDPFMRAGSSELHWIRDWASGLGHLDFNMLYDTLEQNGFLGTGTANLLSITGNLPGSMRTVFENSCFSVSDESSATYNIVFLASIGSMGKIWGCGCIHGEVLDQVVVGGELSTSGSLGGGILAQTGSLVSAIASFRPTKTMFEFNGDMFVVIGTVNTEVTGLGVFTLDRDIGYVDGYIRGTFDVSAIIAGVSGEGEMQWHFGSDFEAIQGKIGVKIYGYLGGVGVESGLFLGANAPKEYAWVMDGIDGRFGLNKGALPNKLTGFYAYMSVSTSVSFYFLASGGFQIYVGLGAFFGPGIIPPFIPVGNVGVRIWGSILGGLVSAAAWGNLQMVGAIPPGFEGSVGLEACVVWVVCGSVSVHCGYNPTNGFYMY